MKKARHSDTQPTENSRRRELIYGAMEALYDEILDRERALAALELVYFGAPRTEPSAQPAAAPEKEPRGSTRKRRKKAAKGKTRRKLSQTPAAKLARDYREKKKAEAAAAGSQATPEKVQRGGSKPATIPATLGDPQPAGKATGAHEAMKAKTEAEIDREAAALDRPGNALIDRKARQERKLAARTEPQPAPDPQPAERKPTTLATVNGTLQGLTQRDAIKAVLKNAARPLDSSQLLVRLLNGGFQFKSENPKAALSVALATYRGELTTETRAGRVFYYPIERGEE